MTIWDMSDSMQREYAKGAIVSMTENQRNCLYFLCGIALESKQRDYKQVLENNWDQCIPISGFPKVANVFQTMNQIQINVVKFLISKVLEKRNDIQS